MCEWLIAHMDAYNTKVIDRWHELRCAFACDRVARAARAKPRTRECAPH